MADIIIFPTRAAAARSGGAAGPSEPCQVIAMPVVWVDELMRFVDRVLERRVDAPPRPDGAA